MIFLLIIAVDNIVMTGFKNHIDKVYATTLFILTILGGLFMAET